MVKVSAQLSGVLMIASRCREEQSVVLSICCQLQLVQRIEALVADSSGIAECLDVCMSVCMYILILIFTPTTRYFCFLCLDDGVTPQAAKAA